MLELYSTQILDCVPVQKYNLVWSWRFGWVPITYSILMVLFLIFFRNSFVSVTELRFCNSHTKFDEMFQPSSFSFWFVSATLHILFLTVLDYESLPLRFMIFNRILMRFWCTNEFFAVSLWFMVYFGWRLKLMMKEVKFWFWIFYGLYSWKDLDFHGSRPLKMKSTTNT